MTPQRDRGCTRAIYVVQTYALGCAKFEIQVAPEPDAAAPRVALVTTDVRIYNRALAAEDHPRCFDVTWHAITTPFGLQYQIDRFDERT